METSSCKVLNACSCTIYIDMIAALYNQHPNSVRYAQFRYINYAVINTVIL